MKHTQLAETMNASMDAHAFSGVVSLRQGGQVLYEQAAGYADRSNKIANTVDTRFGIASGTKFLTALAIGKLIAAQKLTFSTRLRDCVALNFPHYAPEITIQHLLTHTAGIPDYFDEEKFTDFDHFSVSRPWYELRGPRDYLAVFPDEPMKFPPGTQFSYSNGGYILLGVVIEELTGMKYQEYVEQAIFKAIGMNRSGFFAFNQLPEKTAFGYIEEADGWRTNIYSLPIVGASDGGAYTTVDDLATLWKAFWANRSCRRRWSNYMPHPTCRQRRKGRAPITVTGFGSMRRWLGSAQSTSQVVMPAYHSNQACCAPSICKSRSSRTQAMAPGLYCASSSGHWNADCPAGRQQLCRLQAAIEPLYAGTERLHRQRCSSC